MNEQQKLTQALSEDGISSKIRTVFQQHGIPATEPMTISFKVGDTEVETTKLPGLSSSIKTAQSDKDIKADFKEAFKEIDGVEKLMNEITSEKSESVTVTLKHGQNLDQVMTFGVDWCCPCPNNPAKRCCWC